MRLFAFILALSITTAPLLRAQTTNKAFMDNAKQAVGLLFSQTDAGGMNMHCTATAYEKSEKKDSKGQYVYRFLSAAHCVGSDRRGDKERSATTANQVFYISFDESHGSKEYWPAKVLWVGYQSRGEDFSVFEVRSSLVWPTIPIGDEHKLTDGAQYWNFASPLGLGRQVQEGVIASMDLDRPLVDGDINWSHTLVLQQVGVNGGSSGSAIVSKDTRAIVGTLVGTVGGSTIIAIPISRFIAVQKAIDAGKYKYWEPEVNVAPDGTMTVDK